MNASHWLVLTTGLATCTCSRSTPPSKGAALSDVPDTVAARPGAITGSSAFTRLGDSAGHHRIHLVNQRFLLTRLYQRYQGQSRPLIRETVDETCCLDGERDTWATISLEGWASVSQAGTQPAWHAQIKADEGAIWDQFYRAVLFGCCDATDALTYVNIQTGKVAFVSSRVFDSRDLDIPHLRVPNSSLERWAAFLDTYTELDVHQIGGGDSSVVGILQYGPGSQPAPRYVVRWSGGPGFSYRLGKLEFTVDDTAHTHGAQVDLWRANAKEDASALSGFWITVHLLGREYGDRDVPNLNLQVPVLEDRVRPDRANLPSGWSIAALSVGS